MTKRRYMADALDSFIQNAQRHDFHAVSIMTRGDDNVSLFGPLLLIDTYPLPAYKFATV